MYLFHSLLAMTLLITAIQSFASISISKDVTAGQNTTVTVVNDDNDAMAVNYTVGLYTSVQNSPICILIDSFPISTTEFEVSIPASVGPSGFYYRIDLISFNENNTILFPFPTYTDLFFLHNGTGVLSSFEIGSGFSFIGNTFYNGPIPCGAYDCARQCVRSDPPDYTTSGGLADGGYTIYDSRYLSCLESCPGVESPLPVELFASTTTGTWPLATVVPEVATVNASCSVEVGETPCGALCCASGEECWHWGTCESAGVLRSSPTTSSRGSGVKSTKAASTVQKTATAAGSSSTGGASSSGGKVQSSPFFGMAIVSILVLGVYA